MTHDPQEGQDHSHDHAHDDHAPIQAAEPEGRYQLLAEAVRELLIEKGHFTADQHRAMVEKIDARTPSVGAKIVARAWTDPAFKRRLLDDGKAACAELGVDVNVANLLVVENTPEVHNVIVCTLCSCYPRMLLGIPPEWYKSRAYRSRVVREPRAVLAEFGTQLAAGVRIRVHDSTADMRYMVLPLRPAGTDGWSEERLAALVTRDALIGVAQLPDVIESRASR
jgi:nitrile hydratase